jgi:PKD repeat protein
VRSTDGFALKGLYFELAYDPERFDPLSAEPTAALADSAGPAGPGGGDRAISLSVLSQAGEAALGQVLTLPATRAGLEGDAVLARLSFAGRPFSPRQSSAAPVTPKSATTLSLDNASRELTWYFYSQGDYDENGETNIADLQPIGVHWKATTHGAGEFLPASVESEVDGDANGEINIADLQPIGLNYKKAVAGYHIFTSDTADGLPAQPGDPSTLLPAADVPLSAASGDPHDGRLRFSYTFPTLADKSYVWVRPFDPASEGTPSNAVQYAAPNQKPTAAISADLSSGAAPLSVTLDASASHDPDGSIVKYEFDWDGQAGGVHWTDNGAAATALHSYDTPGSYKPFVRVTDDRGATATATLGTAIVVAAHTNQTPTPVLDASPSSGQAVLNVSFDATGSSDSDGTIVTYDFDFDGDGVYDQSGPLPTANHSYTAPGLFQALLRVTDDGGQSATTLKMITVSPATGGTPPVADLQPDHNSGVAPLSVNFDASASHDPDGTITDYQWDWSYNGFSFSSDEDTGTTAAAAHTFATPGNYAVAVQVTDNDGLTAVMGATIQVFGSGPTAKLTATPRYGPPTLSVTFDAGASEDHDGTITLYEWDWNGDGTYDSNGTSASVQHSYSTPGVYDANVRLTDSNNRQSKKTMLVWVTPNANTPPPDSIFALPSQSTAHDGEVVTVEVYTVGAAHPFQYMSGCGLTLENGNTYATQTFDAGVLDYDGLPGNVDGVWTAVGPSGGFLLVPDNFIQPTDIGGGRSRYDFNVTPLGGIDISGATGAMFNFGLTVHSTVSFGFMAQDSVKRTYYNSATTEYLWGDSTDSGAPGITLLP